MQEQLDKWEKAAPGVMQRVELHHEEFKKLVHLASLAVYAGVADHG
jgi:hypothetical protein